MKATGFQVAITSKPYQAFSMTYKVSGRLRATRVQHPGVKSCSVPFLKAVGCDPRANERGNGSYDDEKREHRHEHRQGDVACDRPAVVAIEAIEGIEENM
jgi:hypothetical protein